MKVYSIIVIFDRAKPSSVMKSSDIEEFEKEMQSYLYYKDKYVVKKSGRKFKSGLKENKVCGIYLSKIKPGRPVFGFYDDDSMVECRACKLVIKLTYYL